MTEQYKQCPGIQEKMSCQSDLMEEDRQHVRICQACQSFQHQLLSLDKLVLNEFGVQVPRDFAASVLQKIESEQTAKPKMFEKHVPFRAVRVVIMAVAGLISASQFLKYLFTILRTSLAAAF